MTVSAEDIVWARQAISSGRSMSFVASVLEMSERKAQKLIFSLADSRLQQEIKTPEPQRGPQPRPFFRTRLLRAPEAETPPARRRGALRRQFSRHWEMIWFLRGTGMCGRSLRAIYGAEALIWSVGGGIDAEI